MATINLKVEGITCGGCEKSIQKALLAHDGVSSASASHEAGMVDINYDDAQIQPEALKQAIEDAGFDVVAA
jgi:copper chaperone CopZ